MGTELRTFCADCIKCFWNGMCQKQDEARVPEKCPDLLDVTLP